MKSSKDINSSFHRINSEMNSDLSDDSEAESELNSSLRSNMSSASKRSMWNATKVLNSTTTSKASSHFSTNTLRQRSYGVSNQSMASTKPASELNTSFGSERGFYGGSQMNLTRDAFNTSQRSFVTAQSPDVFGRTQCPSVMSFHSMDRNFANTETSFRSASRNSFYGVPNDFESGITQLSISGATNKHLNANKQSRVFGSPDLFSDVMCNRRPLLSPSRLSLNDTHHASNQSSWLAGGYWNSTSPQKRAPIHTYTHSSEQPTAAKDVFPMISRASSKSSGFESRENSLCDDAEIDRTILLAEPTSLTQAARVSNSLIKPQPQKPMKLFNGMYGDNYKQPASVILRPKTTPNVFTNSTGEFNKSPPNFPILSRSFSEFSLQQPKTSHFHNNMLSSNQSITSNSNLFGRHKQDMPMRTFQRGSLLKLHDHAAMDH